MPAILKHVSAGGKGGVLVPRMLFSPPFGAVVAGGTKPKMRCQKSGQVRRAYSPCGCCISPPSRQREDVSLIGPGHKKSAFNSVRKPLLVCMEFCCSGADPNAIPFHNARSFLRVRLRVLLAG